MNEIEAGRYSRLSRLGVSLFALLLLDVSLHYNSNYRPRARTHGVEFV